MNSSNLTPEDQREIELWRSKDAYHLGFTDKEAWQEIQKEKYEKSLAGRVDVKLTQVKTAAKSAVKGILARAKDYTKIAWSGVVNFFKEYWMGIGIFLVVFTVLSIVVLVREWPWAGSANSSYITASQLDAAFDLRGVATDKAVTMEDLKNFPQLVKMERFHDGSGVIEFLTEDGNYVALKFDLDSYNYLYSRKNYDPRLVYYTWKIQEEKDSLAGEAGQGKK